MEKPEAWPESLTHNVFGSQSLESCDNTACKAKSLCDSTAKNSEFGLQWRVCMQLHNCDGGLFSGGCVEKSFGRAFGKAVCHQGVCGPMVAWCVAHLWGGLLSGSYDTMRSERVNDKMYWLRGKCGTLVAW